MGKTYNWIAIIDSTIQFPEAKSEQADSFPEQKANSLGSSSE